MKFIKLTLIFSLLFVINGFAQENYLGDGPYSQLIIRGVTLINGDGSPPRGPMDIVVENGLFIIYYFFFFFQAEDGIRDISV